MSKRLFEAMVEANHRALAGDSTAGLHPSEFEDELPLVALTCVDARLNALLPQALGIPAEQFIWLRNAGNIVTGAMSSTMRSLALACAVKGGKAIAIIGHTDCQVGKTSAMQLLDRFRALGIERHMLPDNLNEFFGVFGSDRQNVIKAAELVRSSPLIGPRVGVHGLLIDIETGRLEWLVNGYNHPAVPAALSPPAFELSGQPKLPSALGEFKLTELKFPESKIGELASNFAQDLAHKIQPQSGAAEAPGMISLGSLEIPVSKIGDLASSVSDEIVRRVQAASSRPTPSQAKPALPPKIPMPPPIRPRILQRKPSR